MVLYYLLTSNIFFTGVARRFGPGESNQCTSGGEDYFGNLDIESFFKVVLGGQICISFL